jgi:hypothetical protein
MFDCLLSFLSRAILQRNDFVFWGFEQVWKMSGSSPSCSLAGVCAETNEANMNDFGHDGGQAGFPWSVRLKRLIDGGQAGFPWSVRLKRLIGRFLSCCGSTLTLI